MDTQVGVGIKSYPLELAQMMEKLVGEVLASDADSEAWDLANDIQGLLNKWR